MKTPSKKNIGIVTLPSGSTVDTNRCLTTPNNTKWWVTCHRCKQSRYVQIGNWNTFNGRHWRCRDLPRKGFAHGNCKGLPSIDYYGYKLRLISLLSPSDTALAHAMTKDRNYVLEHRLVMASHLGRPLRSDEIVHHVDGVKHNNKIDNLFLTNKEEHRSDHVQSLKRLMQEINYLQGLLASHGIPYTRRL